MDRPEDIVKESLETHIKMINEYKGVPGVSIQRLKEGYEVTNYCVSPRSGMLCPGEALRSVSGGRAHDVLGDNRLIEELHQRSISTFLVTNAQFPDQMEVLTAVAQLYV